MIDKKMYSKLIFKKYKITSLLGKGSFGYVFKGINIINKENVAIKTEQWKIKGDLLESEAYFLYYLKGFGIPEVKAFGVFGKYKVLVENLLGNSLEDIFNKSHCTFTLKDICMIAIQLIDRFEYIHSKYIIHRDIKPENIVVDFETNKIIYLIDFGLSKKYRSSRTGKHIKFSIPKRMTGTARFASRNALSGREQSRRDDLESIGYVLIYFGKKGVLPWQGLKAKNKLERYAQIYYIKKRISPKDLCSGLPKEFTQYIKYVKDLKFEENPDYNYLRGLFMNILIKYNLKNDLNFSWLKNEKKNRKTKKNDNMNNNNIIINIKKRKESPQTRLYRNILKSSKEKNNSNNKSNRNKDLKEEEEKRQNIILLKVTKY
jgi:casein kinase I family protein HRR25